LDAHTDQRPNDREAVPVLGAALAIAAETTNEASVWSVHVDDAQVLVRNVSESVDDSDRHGDPAARANTNLLVSQRELGLAFEDVEGIDVVPVSMGPNSEAWTETGVDRLELR
jgi:hypothetical protein